MNELPEGPTDPDGEEASHARETMVSSWGSIFRCLFTVTPEGILKTLRILGRSIVESKRVMQILGSV